MHAGSFQSWPTFCSPTDCSQPGSSVHGILQARVLERASLIVQLVKNPPAMQEIPGRFLDQEDLLENG